MDAVRVDGDKILENVPAIFDTGANLIFGDWNQISELYGRIGGTLDEYRGYGLHYRELRYNVFGTLFLSTACSTLRLFPDSELYLRRQNI
jgi:hypothetical protein